MELARHARATIDGGSDASVAAMTASTTMPPGCFPFDGSIRHSALPTEAAPQANSFRRRAILRSVRIALLITMACGMILLLWSYQRAAIIPSCTVHGVCELRFWASIPSPFEVDFGGTFACKSCSQSNDIGQGSPCSRHGGCTVRGFYDGGSEYVLRFSPPHAGTWTYLTRSSAVQLHQLGGSLSAGTVSGGGGRGPAAAFGLGFRFADGTEYLPIGTTAYAWAHQNFSMREATLRTLAGPGRAFNKLRFTVFPKWYTYNQEEPPSRLYPYTGSPPNLWDFRTFEPRFWRHFETLVARLMAQSVVADIILFHPYDHGHWGFDCMGGTDAETYNVSNDVHYIRYAVARLAVFSNVWWSMANEWDFVKCKAKGLPNETKWGRDIQAGPSPIWDELFAVLVAEDPYGRETSIHNAKVLYNHSQPWVRHVSLQGLKELTPVLLERHRRPVIWDEVGYEGDLPEVWGALTGVEAADRFWWAASLGAFAGHSETILQAGVPHQQQVMWWSKGGVLRGSSPARIGWFKQYMQSGSHPPFSLLTSVNLTASAGCAARALVAEGRFALLHVRMLCTRQPGGASMAGG